MKILVLSDSHNSLDYMQQCVEQVKPDCILHLGDMYADGAAIAAENPNITFYQVPGNCDLYRMSEDVPEILMPRIGGVNFYMTHGHRHSVKTYISLLLRAARAAKADVVLYGHTHMETCHQEMDGMWVMNPGSCGYYGGTAGLVEVENGKVKCCRILRRNGRTEDYL